MHFLNLPASQVGFILHMLFYIDTKILGVIILRLYIAQCSTLNISQSS